MPKISADCGETFGQAPTRGVTIFLLRNKFLQVVDASLRRTTVNAGPWPAVRQLGKVIVLDRVDALRIRARFFDPSVEARVFQRVYIGIHNFTGNST